METNKTLIKELRKELHYYQTMVRAHKDRHRFVTATEEQGK